MCQQQTAQRCTAASGSTPSGAAAQILPGERQGERLKCTPVSVSFGLPGATVCTSQWGGNSEAATVLGPCGGRLGWEDPCGEEGLAILQSSVKQKAEAQPQRHRLSRASRDREVSSPPLTTNRTGRHKKEGY